MNDEFFMRLAIDEAKKSFKDGEKTPFGAVIVKDYEVISSAHNTVRKSLDTTAHAEINAIREASNKLGNHHLENCVLYTTCEPCPMCTALAVWANITTVVYGASIEETALLGKSRIRVSAAEIVRRSPGWTEVIGGVLSEECLDLYR